jgi:hypothetical protein
MFRQISAILALTCAAAPAAASTYSANPSQPAAPRIIVRDIVWNCGSGACQGATEESRPAVVCQGLVKKAGRVDRFVVDGRAFSAAELERCNASAKSGPATKALAAQ